MKEETFKRCLEIAVGFKSKYNTVVTASVFKDTLAHTLHKYTLIKGQVDKTADEYIPLLFNDCLYEHYMFANRNYGFSVGGVVDSAIR